MLNSIPAPEAVRTLRVLSTETNAPVILSTLRDVATNIGGPSTDSAASAISDDAPESLEFEIQNPIAYPVIRGQDPKELDEEPRSDQSATMTQESASSS